MQDHLDGNHDVRIRLWIRGVLVTDPFNPVARLTAVEEGRHGVPAAATLLCAKTSSDSRLLKVPAEPVWETKPPAISAGMAAKDFSRAWPFTS